MSLVAHQEDNRSALPCEINPDLWFEELRRHKRRARQGCHECPLMVSQACLEYALAREEAGTQEWGIWGGLDMEERKALLEERKILREGRRRAPEVQAA